MAEDVDIEASGLLDGLEGKARAERAELIPWLLERGITVEQIRNAFAPMLLASRRVIGDDGTYVSADNQGCRCGRAARHWRRPETVEDRKGRRRPVGLA